MRKWDSFSFGQTMCFILMKWKKVEFQKHPTREQCENIPIEKFVLDLVKNLMDIDFTKRMDLEVLKKNFKVFHD